MIRINDAFYDESVIYSFVDKLGKSYKPMAKNMLVKLCHMSDKVAGYAWGKDYISDVVFENIAAKAVKQWIN